MASINFSAPFARLNFGGWREGVFIVLFPFIKMFVWLRQAKVPKYGVNEIIRARSSELEHSKWSIANIR